MSEALAVMDWLAPVSWILLAVFLGGVIVVARIAWRMGPKLRRRRSCPRCGSRVKKLTGCECKYPIPKHRWHENGD